MIRVFAFMRRLPGVSRDAFRTHYEEIHVPIALPFLTGTSGYVRHHVREELYGKPDFDCMTRFDYPDAAAVQAVFARTEGPAAETIRRDERIFMDKPAIVFFPVEEAPGWGVRESSVEATRLLVCLRGAEAEGRRLSTLAAAGARVFRPCAPRSVTRAGAARTSAFSPRRRAEGFDAVIEIAAEGAGEIASWARAREAEGASVVAVRVSVHETRMPA